jgi:hypothetical protein
MNTYFQKKQAEALLSFLEYAHADQYIGLDDDMPDDCSKFIANMTEDEVITLIVSVYRNGL